MSADRTIRLYNTATRAVEPVVPAEEGHLRFYNCGPTVYSFAHIGNFRTFLTADLIVRLARAVGLRVSYVTNITDVGHLTEDDVADAGGEDKMEKALASKDGRRFSNVWDLARFYADALQDDWKALNLMEPSVRPRATEHVTGQIEAIERLIEGGHAYATAKGVYFAVNTFPGYGSLSGNDAADELAAAVRDVVVDPEKRDPRDFALWKSDPGHLMQWYSPFGRGFPGWHIECSVMSMAYLGETIDLHGGGEDLIFPHHECEVAQSESLTGKPFVRHWVHTRFLQVEGEKMSKSKGNFYTVRDLIAPPPEGRGVDPLALRYALISGKYRDKFNFTLKHLSDSAKIVARYKLAAELVAAAIDADRPGEDFAGTRLAVVYEETLAAMLDDLNTPVALAAALQGAKLIHGMGDLNGATARSAAAWLEKTNALLGIIAHDAAQPSEDTLQSEASSELAAEVDRLLAERAEARRARDFTRADAIRAAIDSLGVEVMDSPEGTKWRKRAAI